MCDRGRWGERLSGGRDQGYLVVYQSWFVRVIRLTWIGLLLYIMFLWSINIGRYELTMYVENCHRVALVHVELSKIHHFHVLSEIIRVIHLYR